MLGRLRGAGGAPAGGEAALNRSPAAAHQARQAQHNQQEIHPRRADGPSPSPPLGLQKEKGEKFDRYFTGMHRPLEWPSTPLLTAPDMCVPPLLWSPRGNTSRRHSTPLMLTQGDCTSLARRENPGSTHMNPPVPPALLSRTLKIPLLGSQEASMPLTRRAARRRLVAKRPLGMATSHDDPRASSCSASARRQCMAASPSWHSDAAAAQCHSCRGGVRTERPAGQGQACEGGSELATA